MYAIGWGLLLLLLVLLLLLHAAEGSSTGSGFKSDCNLATRRDLTRHGQILSRVGSSRSDIAVPDCNRVASGRYKQALTNLVAFSAYFLRGLPEPNCVSLS
jgi:hypothetical protein